MRGTAHRNWRVTADIAGIPDPTPEQLRQFRRRTMVDAVTSYNNRTGKLHVAFTIGIATLSPCDGGAAINMANEVLVHGLDAFDTYTSIDEFHIVNLNREG